MVALKILAGMAALAGTAASADLYFGNLAGERATGGAKAPSQEQLCHYFLVQGPASKDAAANAAVQLATSVLGATTGHKPGGPLLKRDNMVPTMCMANEYHPQGDTGGCPNQNGKAPDFCGLSLTGTKCPKSYQLKKGDDCGKAMNDNHGGAPPTGTPYADVIDTANKDKVVGHCMYIRGNDGNCGFLGSQLVSTFIECYMFEGC